ncbi:hypothetical protein MLD38_007915 [Melastoma candidum]|uniref:Uncharacterized protein n=1 Tax=Melastoma candidum TaxID=119954 RepID=A0ACB9S166_9MYRT|nr:hypothetical protein MLD38_007915 [Melastoma candidum]
MGRAARWFKGIFGGLARRRRRRKARTGIRAALGRFPVIRGVEKEQSRQAIAFATATAAAADAAVAAAQAAVAVVRLTSQGRGAMFVGGGRERWAAGRIQAVFRGYLVSLASVVNSAALVRGYLVRKRAAATLHSKQALIRAQTAARSRRAPGFSRQGENKMRAENWPRRSIEMTVASLSRKTDLKKILSVETNLTRGYPHPTILRLRSQTASTRAQRLSRSTHTSRERDLAGLATTCSSNAGTTTTLTTPSRPLCRAPCQLVSPFPRAATGTTLIGGSWGDECKFSTAHNTPRFWCLRGWHHVPTTPTRACAGMLVFRPYANNHPNYMANTKSFNAKVRSQRRPEAEAGTGVQEEAVAERDSGVEDEQSGARMQRSVFEHPTGEE